MHRWVGVALITVVAVALGGLAADLGPWGGQSGTLHPGAAAVLLTPFTIWLIRRVAAGDRRVEALLVLAWLAKLVGTVLRYRVSTDVYGHLADAGFYHRSGTAVAEWLAEGFFWPSDERVAFRGTGTSHLAYVVGLIYRVTGARILTGYVVLSWWSFMGLLGCYRAAVTAVPDLDRRRLALLVLLLPTVVFWPSSIGKEAWILGWLGIAALGVSRCARGRLDVATLALLGLGLWGIAFVRPHVAALVAGSLALSFLWLVAGGASLGRRVATVIAAGLLLVAASTFLSEFMDDLGLDQEERGVSDVLTFTEERTSEGRSEFTAVRATDPISAVPAVVSTFFRPFPHEARSAVQLATAAEGVLLLVVVMLSWRRLRHLPAWLSHSLYLRFCAIYAIGFAVAFSSISNFGILARQRAQLWPILLVLLAIPRSRPGPARSAAALRGSLRASSDRTDERPIAATGAAQT
jgi:hypothetical protein